MEGTASANAKARTKLMVRIDISPGRTSRRLVGQLDNQGLFPDICTESGKWFRGSGELFRRGGRDDTMTQKAQRFQGCNFAFANPANGRMIAGSLAEEARYDPDQGRSYSDRLNVNRSQSRDDLVLCVQLVACFRVEPVHQHKDRRRGQWQHRCWQ
jgi:hypothetical protein